MEEKKIEKFVEDSNKKLDAIEKSITGKVDEKDFTEVKGEIKGIRDEIDKLGKVGEKSLDDYVQGLQKHCDTLESQMKELKESGVNVRGKSLEQEIEEQMKEGKENFLAKMRKSGVDKDDPGGLELKASTVTESNSFTNTYYEAVPTAPRLPGIQVEPFPQPLVWNLLSVGVTDRRYIPYVEQTAETYAATAVAEGSAGGQADVSFTDRIATVRKISAKLYASLDILDDVPYLASEIRRHLNQDIVQYRENQILTGTGASNQLQGLVYTSDPIAQAFSQPTGFDDVPDADESTVLNAAIIQVMLGQNATGKTGYMASGIVMHPVQHGNMMESRDGQNSYRKHPLLSADGKTFNGIPIVLSKYIDSDTYLVGDFRQARAFVRKGISIRMLDQNSDYGEKDIMTFLISQRLAFFVPQPHQYAFVYGTFDAGISALTEAQG